MKPTILTYIDRGTDEIVGLYRATQSAMTGELSSAIDGEGAFSSRGLTDLHAGLMGAAARMTDAVMQRMDALNQTLITFALEAVDLPEAYATVAEIQQPAVHAFALDLQASFAADAAAIEKRYREFQWDARLQTLSGQRTRTGALLHARMGRMLDLRFKRANQAGRTFETAYLVHLAARATLLQAYNDAIALGLTSKGHETGEFVLYDGGGSKVGYAAFTMAGERGYMQVRAEVMHPNSNVLAQRMNADV